MENEEEFYQDPLLTELESSEVIKTISYRLSSFSAESSEEYALLELLTSEVDYVAALEKLEVTLFIYLFLRYIS